MKIKKKSEKSFPYTLADLAWESVRRNERYKRHYKNLKKDKNTGGKMMDPGFVYDYKLLKAYDPRTDSIKIHEQIQKGERSSGDIPYSHLYGMFNEVVVNSLEFPRVNRDNLIKLINNDRQAIESHIWLLIEFARLILANEGLMVVSVNPYQANERIFDEIKNKKVDFALIRKEEKKECEYYYNDMIQAFKKSDLANYTEDDLEKISDAQKIELADDVNFDHLRTFDLNTGKIYVYVNHLKNYDTLVKKAKKLVKSRNRSALEKIVLDDTGCFVKFPKKLENDIFANEEDIAKLKKNSNANKDNIEYFISTVLDKNKSSYETAVKLIGSAPTRWYFQSGRVDVGRKKEKV